MPMPASSRSANQAGTEVNTGNSIMATSVRPQPAMKALKAPRRRIRTGTRNEVATVPIGDIAELAPITNESTPWRSRASATKGANPPKANPKVAALVKSAIRLQRFRSAEGSISRTISPSRSMKQIPYDLPCQNSPKARQVNPIVAVHLGRMSGPPNSRSVCAFPAPTSRPIVRLRPAFRRQ